MQLFLSRARKTSFNRILNYWKFSSKIPFNNNLQGFIQNYYNNGHNHAFLDPLGLNNNLTKSESFDPEFWQLSEIESIDGFPLDYRLNSDYYNHCTTVGDLRNHLDKLYTGSVGVEFSHVESEEERLWLHLNYERLMLEPTSQSE